MKKIIYTFLIVFIAISCNEVKKDTIINNSEAKKSDVAASYKSIEVDIEGMTCEIGCARTIQSKLSKVNGITYSKVNFETNKGQFTYNENEIDKDEIVNKINGIAGGDLYKVTKTTDIEEIIEEIE